MPFRNETFDAVFCCYLLELLSGDDIARTLAEFRRVLRPGCRLTLVLIGQNTAALQLRLQGGWAGSPPPSGAARWSAGFPSSSSLAQFRLLEDHFVRQIYYPSRVLVAQKP